MNLFLQITKEEEERKWRERRKVLKAEFVALMALPSVTPGSSWRPWKPMMPASLPSVPRGGRGRRGSSARWATSRWSCSPCSSSSPSSWCLSFSSSSECWTFQVCHRDGYAVQSLGWLLRARCCATTGAMVVVVPVLSVFLQCLVRPWVHVFRQLRRLFGPLRSAGSPVSVVVQRQVPADPFGPFMPPSSSTTVVWLVVLVTMHLALCWQFTLYSIVCRQAQDLRHRGRYGLEACASPWRSHRCSYWFCY